MELALPLLKKLLMQDLSQRKKILLILAHFGKKSTVAQVKKIAVDSGIEEAENWPVAQNLNGIKTKGRKQGRVTNDGKSLWTLTLEGKKHVQNIIDKYNGDNNPAVEKTASDLRTHLKKIKNEYTYSFVEEAIRCYENKCYRSAIIMSWQGALNILYQHVFNNRNILGQFNKEAKRTMENMKKEWMPTKSIKNFPGMEESKFLDIIKTIGLIDQSVKAELKSCLDLRNACSHPSSLKVGEHKCASHIEVLIQNIFQEFSKST